MKTVAVIVQDGFAPFEFGVACEAFGLDRSADGIPNFDFRIVTPDPGVVNSKMGFSINVEHDLSFAYEADLVVVSPTPSQYWARSASDERVLDVIRAAVARDAWVLSVCSGSFVVAASGVLDGRKATTHWMYADRMAQMYPLVDVDPDVLYVQDGRIITSAGTAAGLDACLHLLEHYDGASQVNVGTGSDVTIRDIAETIAKVVGFEGETTWDTSKPDGTPQKLLDVSKLASAGWTSKISLEDGLTRTVEWYRAHRESLRG